MAIIARISFASSRVVGAFSHRLIVGWLARPGPEPGSLPGETRSRAGQLAQRQAEAGIVAQVIEVVGILVAAGDRKDPRAQDVVQRMDHPRGIAPIGDARSKPFANPHPSLGLRQQQHPAVRGEPAAVESGGHLFATHCWKAEDRHAIVNGGGVACGILCLAAGLI